MRELIDLTMEYFPESDEDEDEAPILIATPGDDDAPTPDLLVGRTHASIALPARYMEIVGAIARLVTQSEEKADNAAVPSPS